MMSQVHQLYSEQYYSYRSSGTVFSVDSVRIACVQFLGTVHIRSDVRIYPYRYCRLVEIHGPEVSMAKTMCTEYTGKKELKERQDTTLVRTSTLYKKYLCTVQVQ